MRRAWEIDGTTEPLLDPCNLVEQFSYALLELEEECASSRHKNALFKLFVCDLSLFVVGDALRSIASVCAAVTSRRSLPR